MINCDYPIKEQLIYTTQHLSCYRIICLNYKMKYELPLYIGSLTKVCSSDA